MRVFVYSGWLPKRQQLNELMLWQAAHAAQRLSVPINPAHPCHVPAHSLLPHLVAVSWALSSPGGALQSASG